MASTHPSRRCLSVDDPIVAAAHEGGRVIELGVRQAIALAPPIHRRDRKLLALRYTSSARLESLRTSFGWRWVGLGLFHRAWPLLSRLACAYRATAARDTRVVAVVGSLGKTTTTRSVAAVLGGNPDARVRNYYSHLAAGVLAIRPRDRYRVFEVGISERGTMEQYARMLEPNVVVVTSVTREHHTSLPDLDVTRTEKAAMVRALPASGIAILNGDDENVRWMASQTRAVVRTFGFGADNDVRAVDCRIDWPRGMRLKVLVAGEEHEVRVRLLGRHLVYPVLGALAVAFAEGVSLHEAVAALEALEPAPGRMETVPLANGAFIIRDDSKGTLETIESALDVLAEIPARRRFVVLGDVEEAPTSPDSLYPSLGARLASIADRAVFVHADPEGPRYIPGASRAGAASEAMTDARAGVLEAARILGRELRAGDVVLVKGAGAQRLERITLAVTGHTVLCQLAACGGQITRCSECPMLARGWASATRVFV